MTRILLIRPKTRPSTLSLALPPLGPMYLVSYLRKHGPDGCEARILDLTVEHRGFGPHAGWVREFSPDIVGISALSPEAGDAAVFATLMRKWFRDAWVLVGGPLPNASPSYVARHPAVDAIVLGEGEQTFVELVRARQEHGRGFDLTQIPGVAAWRGNGDGKLVAAPPREMIENLDAVPFPAWDAVPLLDYCSWRVINPSISRHYKLFTTMFTSRACPYRCGYCHNIFGRRWRPRSAANVVQEMIELAQRYNIREYHICDDAFNLDKERVVEICDRMIEAGLNARMAFVSGLRGDILDERVINKLAQAGTYQISFGIETTSERLQKQIGRDGDLSALKRNMDLAHGAGIMTHGFLIFGFPTETEAEMRASIKFAQRSNLITCAFHSLVPYPGTRIGEIWQERNPGKELNPVLLNFKSAGINLSEVPTERMHRLIKRGFLRFFFRPWRIWALATRTPRKIDVIISFVFHLLLDPRLMMLRSLGRWIAIRRHDTVVSLMEGD